MADRLSESQWTRLVGWARGAECIVHNQEIQARVGTVELGVTPSVLCYTVTVTENWEFTVLVGV